MVDEKNAVNIRRICVKRLVQGYDGFLLLILHLIQYRARHEGAYDFGAGETLKRRNNAPEEHPGLADDQQPRGQESKRYNTKIVQCAIPTETQQKVLHLDEGGFCQATGRLLSNKRSPARLYNPAFLTLLRLG